MDNEDLKLILSRLEGLRDQLVELNKVTGANDRATEMRKEILALGWNYILNRYHPDVNHELGAYELFKMYKFVYEDMKKKNEI